MNKSDKENLNEAYEIVQEGLMGAIRRTGDRLKGIKSTYDAYKLSGKVSSYKDLKNDQVLRRIAMDAAEDIVKHNMLDKKFKTDLTEKIFMGILGFLRDKGFEI